MPPLRTRADLHSALRDDGLTLDSIVNLNEIAGRLYQSSPSLASFSAWSLFRALANEFDDPQAVPTEDITPFVESLLPLLKEWASTDDLFHSVDTITQVVVQFHKCAN